jgi:sporulation protein YlmC with PRC-barrel domain
MTRVVPHRGATPGWAAVLTLTLSLAGALSACHTAPPQRPINSAEPSIPPVEMPPPQLTENDVPAPNTEAPKPDAGVAPCACADNPPKPAPKRKPKPVVQEAPPPTPPAPPAARAPAEASVKREESPASSILGRKVRARDGEDLGRLVDVLADPQGRVSMAIIEFGGFLGVGNRRIAVDWSLLTFQPGDADAPVIVNVSKAKLQATPEYKGAEHPLALMAPAAPAAPPAAPQ